ncbi:uncharacterized protein [Phaseolus vulgaris]|uniref:uncharacterized protein n=1 Tax=Phaseolus vulgaris TaxID=3885 RepID=UPI0035CA9E03
MDSWYSGESSLNTEKETIIRDMVHEFSADDEQEEYIPEEQTFPTSSNDNVQSFSRTTHNIHFDLSEGMSFNSKESTLNAIKQYHIHQGYNFMVVESKPNGYTAHCIHYNNDCQWRIRASFTKIRQQWEIKKIEAPHTCLNTSVSVDHKNLDSSQIASFVVNSVKANPSIPIKTIIAEIKNQLGYSVTYKKAWVAKQKAFVMEFGDWDESYNHLQRWLQVVQDSVPGTVVQYITRTYVVDGVQDESNYILERVFWSFKPCIEGFKYCKPIVQVDGTFLTGKYHSTLLTAISQDGNRNIFPLAFVIVEGETKEALI